MNKLRMFIAGLLYRLESFIRPKPTVASFTDTALLAIRMDRLEEYTDMLNNRLNNFRNMSDRGATMPLPNELTPRQMGELERSGYLHPVNSEPRVAPRTAPRIEPIHNPIFDDFPISFASVNAEMLRNLAGSTPTPSADKEPAPKQEEKPKSDEPEVYF